MRNAVREVVEVIVFVVVLVLLLKAFVAEAFVIPTGSMAETLWGHQKLVPCPQCGWSFPVNASSQVEPRNKRDPVHVTGCICPNCRYDFLFRDEDPKPQSGDRVLVDKSLYDILETPKRFDVVVFKYPENPQDDYTAMNYIKRLLGLPKETIAIYSGDLYVSEDFQYQDPPAQLQGLSKAEHERMMQDYMHVNDENPKQLFQEQIIERRERLDPAVRGKKFKIISKPPEQVLSMRRIVCDNDFQAQDLAGKPRWTSDKNNPAWKTDDAQYPRRFEHAGENLDWLRYRHILRNSDQPQLITDFMGYNAGHPHNPPLNKPPANNWVGDLILECEATIEQAEGELVLELAKGVDRFQAKWDLATGHCTLVRRGAEGEGAGKEEVLGPGSTPTELKKGVHRLRFANVDERLIVWVDNSLPFGAGVPYAPSLNRGPRENDLQPAAVGVRGTARIDHLKLWRDTYYTQNPSYADADGNVSDWSFGSEYWYKPARWEPLRNLKVRTMYVQPDHYLCLGDNSPESSDGRSWGLVPRRLMLGRALLIYWPPFSPNRFGPIR